MPAILLDIKVIAGNAEKISSKRNTDQFDLYGMDVFLKLTIVHILPVPGDIDNGKNVRNNNAKVGKELDHFGKLYTVTGETVTVYGCVYCDTDSVQYFWSGYQD